MTRYRNPWARPYEPQFYETSATPVLYAEKAEKDYDELLKDVRAILGHS